MVTVVVVVAVVAVVFFASIYRDKEQPLEKKIEELDKDYLKRIKEIKKELDALDKGSAEEVVKSVEGQWSGLNEKQKTTFLRNLDVFCDLKSVEGDLLHIEKSSLIISLVCEENDRDIRCEAYLILDYSNLSRATRKNLHFKAFDLKKENGSVRIFDFCVYHEEQEYFQRKGIGRKVCEYMLNKIRNNYPNVLEISGEVPRVYEDRDKERVIEFWRSVGCIVKTDRSIIYNQA